MFKRWVAAAMCVAIVFGSFPVSAEEQSVENSQVISESTGVNTGDSTVEEISENADLVETEENISNEGIVAKTQETQTEDDSATANVEEVQPEVQAEGDSVTTNIEKAQPEVSANAFSAQSSYGTQIDTGSCGNKTTWTSHDSNGDRIGDIVVIKGEGNIESNAFYQNRDIKKVIIEDNISSISPLAFAFMSNLQEVQFPDSLVTIEKQAFQGCSKLQKIVFPDSLQYLGDSAFADCTNIDKVVLPDVDAGGHVFHGCDKLKSVGPVGSGCDLEFSWTDKIPGYFFSGMSIESVILPETIVSLGVGAFSQCTNLKSINIPKSVEMIDAACFSESGIETIDLSYLKVIDSGVFSSCSNLKEVKLSEDLTEIQGYAFGKCFQLKTITIPDSVSHIAKDVFSYSPTKIYAHQGTYAETFAKEQGIPFEVIVQPVEKISLEAPESPVYVGEELELKLMCSPAYPSYSGKPVFTSSNPEVASIISQEDKTVKIKANSYGETTITVTLEGKKAECKLEVFNQLEDFKLDIKKDEIRVGEQMEIQLQSIPEGAYFEDELVWENSQPSVAKLEVDESRRTATFTALQPGETIITVKHGWHTRSYLIRVKNVADSVAIKSDKEGIKVGETMNLHLVTSPENANLIEKVQWQNSNPDAVTMTVDKSGKNVTLSANKTGVSIITATVHGLTATYAVEVGIPIDNLSIQQGEKELYVGDQTQLTYSVSPKDAPINEEVFWYNPNSDVIDLSVDRDGVAHITALSTGVATVTVSLYGIETSCTITVKDPKISASAHVQTYGWQNYGLSPSMIGTTGQSKRMEAVKLYLDGVSAEDGGIEYQSHVQNIGWQNWVKDDAISGTTEQSKRLEAIRIRLYGEVAKKYDIYYRVHAQQFGWLGWTKNGKPAGTAAYSYRLEALEIKLVKKGEAAPGSTASAFKQKNFVKYQSHIQDIGWQTNRYDGVSSGTTGQSKRLEGIKINLVSAPYSGNIQYQTHIQNIGWQSWRQNGAMSGTTAQSKRLEAIKIKLTGEMAEHYDIYYRVHAQDYGWLGWAKNGAPAGTEGMSKRLEAIQIRLVTKGSKAPGSTTNCFYKK